MIIEPACVFQIAIRFGHSTGAAGHFGHSGHQIGKLFYNCSIGDFPKLLSCLSKVSSQRVPNGTRTRSPENVKVRNRGVSRTYAIS